MTASEVWSEPGRSRVLLVDDRPDNLLALEAALEPLGLDLLTARSGEEALRCVLGAEVATIVLDVQMPDMDGLETAALLRSRAATRDIPLILLTAISHDLEHQLRGYELGASDYVCKPVEPAVLRAKVRSFVDLALRVRSLEAQNRSRDEAMLELRERLRAVELQIAEAPARAQSLVGLDRVLEVSFEPSTQAPRIVREAIRSALRGHSVALRERAMLLATELVTNSVIHAGTDGVVRLDLGPSQLRLEVEDRSLLAPRLLEVALNSSRGRGLALVGGLADRCGWTSLESGKSVWLELDLRNRTY